MKVGLNLPQVGTEANRENVLFVAKEAEKEGFDSLWVLERLLWPLKPQSPYGASPDGSLPPEYQNVLDPIDLLTFVAASTEKIGLGTSLIDMLFHNPVILARRFATLDVLSKGRTLAGLGIGWSKDEYQVSNVPFRQTGARADEYLEVLKRIWTDDVVEFKGQFYNIPPSKIGPKPVQRPHPPVLLGGFSPGTFSRIINKANGWLGVAAMPLDQLELMINGFRQNITKAGKRPSDFAVYLLSYPTVLNSPIPDAGRFPFTGTIEQIGTDIARIKNTMDAAHLIFGYGFSSTGRGAKERIEVTKQLARYAR